jgi:hypothetical protein
MGELNSASLPDFNQSFSQAVAALEGAVDHLFVGGWDELLCRHAQELALALASAAKVERRDETERALRALASLLELSPEQEVAIQEAVQTKVRNLFGLIRRFPAAESA